VGWGDLADWQLLRRQPLPAAVSVGKQILLPGKLLPVQQAKSAVSAAAGICWGKCFSTEVFTARAASSINHPARGVG